jgi:hypothetical protein
MNIHILTKKEIKHLNYLIKINGHCNPNPKRCNHCIIGKEYIDCWLFDDTQIVKKANHILLILSFDLI